MQNMIVDYVAEKYPWLPVPFEFDIEYGPSYGELKRWVELKEQEKETCEKTC
jgi:hypothetical protein